MIEVRNLGLKRGDFTLKCIDLSVQSGECLVVVGPSGAGKTLLLESILGIQRPGTGQVLVDGADITRLPLEERRFLFMPQDLALFPHLEVYDNIAFALQSRRVSREDIARRVRKAASWLGIVHLLDRRAIESLSGGEKQRVALARALVTEPRALFLDEPFSSLDSAIRHELYREFGELKRRTGITTLLVTHNHDEALLLGDRMAVLYDGAIIQTGTPEQVYRQPTTVETAKLLLVENLFCAECLGSAAAPSTVRYRVGDLVIHVSSSLASAPKQAWLGIRAHHVRVGHDDGQTLVEGNNRFRAKLQRVTFRADRLLLEVSLLAEQGGVPLLIAVGDTTDNGHFKEGELLLVELPPERILQLEGKNGEMDRHAIDRGCK